LGVLRGLDEEDGKREQGDREQADRKQEIGRGSGVVGRNGAAFVGEIFG